VGSGFNGAVLTTLRIKNLALVPDLTLELAPGYNAITGETGAGKSVIIGALQLVLGERADRSLIRSGAESCAVEAVFTAKDLAGIGPFLEEKGLEPCEEGHLVLKRSFTAAGTNRQFINGSPATLAVLSELGRWLVDMHGPHDHQSLLDPAKQLEILDAYGELAKPRERFAELCARRAALLEQKSELIIDERTYAQQLDLLRFQVREITSAKLVGGEEAQLQADYARASNAARLIELAQTVQAGLGEEENSILSQAGAIGRSLQELARLDPGAEPMAELHGRMVESAQELQRELGRYGDAIEVDPARLHELEQRVDVIQGLKRKYGASVEEVIQFGNEALQKLQALESRDAELERINSEIKRVESDLWKAGSELSAARRKVGPKLSKAVARELGDLGFKQSTMDVQMQSLGAGEAFKGAVSSSGFDRVEFLFAPNPGEPARPLRAIASSGELARVMLALKTVLARQDSIPVLIFDEVDANVGGETAAAVGEKMRTIGAQRQVLCITHLAQVAAAADTHFVVTKETTEGRTVSSIKPLDSKSRVGELTRMLGGGDAARKHAEALLRSVAPRETCASAVPLRKLRQDKP
jgi:DNA repair protein RecN (Recombination protein N)